MTAEDDVRVSVTAAVSAVEDRKESIDAEQQAQRQQGEADQGPQTAAHYCLAK
jgi:hypothetical protein